MQAYIAIQECEPIYKDNKILENMWLYIQDWQIAILLFYNSRITLNADGNDNSLQQY